MANWYGSARSNYFAVKDLTAFEAWAAGAGLHVLRAKDGSGKVGICPGEWSDDGGWPVLYDDADDPRDLAEELQPHLADGEVAMLKEVGAEKLRYLTAHMLVVTPAEIRYFDLEDLVCTEYPTASTCEY